LGAKSDCLSVLPGNWVIFRRSRRTCIELILAISAYCSRGGRHYVETPNGVDDPLLRNPRIGEPLGVPALILPDERDLMPGVH
jgi:hypothetical protein